MYQDKETVKSNLKILLKSIWFWLDWIALLAFVIISFTIIKFDIDILYILIPLFIMGVIILLSFWIIGKQINENDRRMAKKNYSHDQHNFFEET
jgi:hypothetical protein